jgi:DUF1680 family protein
MTNTQDYPIRPVDFNQAKLNDTFWLPRLETLKRTTLPFALEKNERAVENLRRCGAFLRGENSEMPFSHRFVSSDLFKVMEGGAYLLLLEKDEELEAQLDEIISIIGEAQKEDGYLYVAHTCGIPIVSEMGERPYSHVVHSHELYNMGHMYEGAIAYFQATGKREWLDIAEKSANHIYNVFFEGNAEYNDGVSVNQAPGHQEPELALCKLYRATGNERYLAMAKRFLDIRGVTFVPDGEGVDSPRFAQQHARVVEQTEAVGHAVRAGYMYAAMADVCALTGDDSYSKALDAIWSNIVNTRMHITGGLGAVHGIEGFGDEYELPNAEAYNETCAAVANVFFNHRMFLMHQDAKYFDVAEVALLNNALAGVNLEGNKFFYVNPLEADGETKFNHGASGRSPWFDCACCPSNIARLVPQISGYMYAHTDSDIMLLLYGQSQTTIELESVKVHLEQETNYPFGGGISVEVTPNKSAEFTLKLRIPTWTGDQFVPGNLYSFTNESLPWSLKVNGEEQNAKTENGFASISRTWSSGDRVELNLPMPVRFSHCNEKVEANRNRLAITRGPLVYCAEGVDNGASVAGYTLGQDSLAGCETKTITEDVLKGMTQVTVTASLNENTANLNLVPYFAWNNRGDGSMNVWIKQ